MNRTRLQLNLLLILSPLMLLGWVFVSSFRPVFPFGYAILLVLANSVRISMSRESIVRSVSRDLERRNEDAGRWLNAPVAELDKSTVGKLLANRLRREPGLRVVVKPEEPEVCTDALYDPELDGDGRAG